MAGISVYHSESYSEPQRHAYQEGFYVLEGKGYALVADKEIPISPETTFLVPAGTSHSIRTDKGCAKVKVFWFLSE